MKIIQFPHPGAEHKYKKQELANGEKNWNSSKTHARNFIRAKGTYIDLNGIEKNDILTFWGEWEPPAKVHKLNNGSTKGMPKYIIDPIMPKKSPIPGQLNTDPLVFGEFFKYAICRQNQKSVTMKDLQKGSIILFGCVRGTDFLLDTVFVVGETKKKFLLFNSNSLSGITEYTEYKNIVLDTFEHPEKGCSRKVHNAINGCSCKNLTQIDNKTLNTYYEGAPYRNPVNGMYSFMPAKIYDSGDIGFERLKLDTKKQFPELRYKNLQNFCCIERGNITKMKHFWDRLDNATKNAGLVKAVEIPYP